MKLLKIEWLIISLIAFLLLGIGIPAFMKARHNAKGLPDWVLNDHGSFEVERTSSPDFGRICVITDKRTGQKFLYVNQTLAAYPPPSKAE